MTDAQSALAQVREALKAGPTRGNWVVAPKMTMPSIVCAVNNVEVCPADHRDPSHQDVDAAYIAAANPANIAAILAHVEALEAEIERLTAERDELRRQLAEAEQRFDWLATRLEDVQIDDADPNGHYHGDEEDVPYPVLWRRAIDAAMGLTRTAEDA